MRIPRTGRLAVGLALTFASLASTPAAFQNAAEELKAIDAGVRQEAQLLRETMNAAAQEETQAIYDEYLQTVLPEFAERYADVARANQGSEVALEAWTKVVGLASRGMQNPLSAEALRVIASEHLESPGLASLAQSLRYAAPAIGEKEVLAALRAVGDGSPHREVKAAAFYTLGAVLGDERPAGDPRLAEAKRVFGTLSSFGDVQFREGTTYAEAAQSFLFALENLVVGKPCPDFAAVDAEGASFRLSDYKGKVVLVDFWGFW